MGKFAEFSTRDIAEAALLVYSGGWLKRCAIHEDSTEWVVSLPQFDGEIVRQEFANEDASVVIRPYNAAMNQCIAVQVSARRNLGDWRNAGIYGKG